MGLHVFFVLFDAQSIFSGAVIFEIEEFQVELSSYLDAQRYQTETRR